MRHARDERGLTLTELVVVMVLAFLVMVGMVGFYLSSQATWVEASTQAIAQRDGTLILERLTLQTRAAAHATASVSPPQVDLFDGANQALARFEWRVGGGAPDSFVHEWTATTPGNLVDRGPVGTSKVVRFVVSSNDTLVHVTGLSVRTPNGDVVELSTSAALYNRP